jgi:hypothetical protein
MLKQMQGENAGDTDEVSGTAAQGRQVPWETEEDARYAWSEEK